MLQCWQYNPSNRPSFKDCLVQLEMIMSEYESILEENGNISLRHHFGDRLPSLDDSGFSNHISDGMFRT